MKRRTVLVIVLLVGGYFVADAAASSYTLADFTGRPVVLVRQEGDMFKRIAVWAPKMPGETRPADAAFAAQGSGIPFGIRHVFTLPGGSTVTCDHVAKWMWCDDGWRAERQP